jgi:CheY-like chemotaxis protein
MPALTYLVMELVSGGDLEQYVARNGPLSVAQACDWVRQAAQGLQAAHDMHVVHRDVKPSNLLLAAQGQVKLVDFGLVRQFRSQLTDPRALLGSVEFMAPEQSFDPSGVGPEADVYGLGATLFWLLSGEAPYPFMRNVGSALRALQRDPPRRLRELRPDVPAELDDLLACMLERDPARRPSPPLAVSTALAPFTVAPTTAAPPPAPTSGSREQLLAQSAAVEAGRRRVLIVDDEANVRLIVRRALESVGCNCAEAADGGSALAAVAEQPFDLVVLDLVMPGMGGVEVCRRLRERPAQPYLKVVVVSGVGDPGQLAETLPQGADDYLAKPIDLRQLRARVEHALLVKEGRTVYSARRSSSAAPTANWS